MSLSEVIDDLHLEDLDLAALVDDIVEEGMDISMVDETWLADLLECGFEDVDDRIQVHDVMLAPMMSTHGKTSRRVWSSHKNHALRLGAKPCQVS